MLRFGKPPYLECSSRGDKRFSAFTAIPLSLCGRSIEEAYQAAKVFEDGSTGLHWRQAKGRKAINMEQVAKLYHEWWVEWVLQMNLLPVLEQATGLSDMFGQAGHVCQAEVLWRIKMVDFAKITERMRATKARIARGEYHTIIAGSRGLGGVYDTDLVALAAKRSGFNIVRVLSGTARGIDNAGERWAEAQGIPVDKYPADWEGEGKGAGFRRNERMAHNGDALVAIWDGHSRGTRHMIDTMREHEKPVYVLEVTRWWCDYAPNSRSRGTCAIVLQDETIIGCPDSEFIGRNVFDFVGAYKGTLREAK